MTSKHVQVISVLGRSRLPDEVVDLIENQIKALIEIATKAINEDIDACDALMQANGITALGEPMAPLHVTVQVTSPLMRRFLEVLEKCDQLETMIDTLVIDEIVTIDRAENQKRHVKRLVRSISGAARQWEIDVRMKIQATDEEEARAEAAKAAAKRARRNGTAASGNGVDTDADALGEVPPADVSVSAPTQPAG